MKVCNKCKVELVIRENITTSRLKNCDYRCNKCYKSYQSKHYKTNKTKYQNWFKKYYELNSEDIKKQVAKYRKQNPEKAKDAIDECVISIPSGVYEILYKGKRVYVGQSKLPYRRIHNHFTSYTDLNAAINQSPVSYKLSTGKIKRKDLSFNMLQYEDDKQRRLEIEREYITQSTDLWNLL